MFFKFLLLHWYHTLVSFLGTPLPLCIIPNTYHNSRSISVTADMAGVLFCSISVISNKENSVMSP